MPDSVEALITMEALSDEELTFEAALSFLDEFEAAVGCVSPPVGGCENQSSGSERSLGAAASCLGKRRSTRAEPTGRSPRRRTRSNRARDERRYEVLLLRRQAEELDAQLTDLRKSQTSCVRPPVAPTLPRVVLSVGSNWRDTAWKQRSQRQSAEKENVRLRLLVEQQVKTSKRIKKLLLTPKLPITCTPTSSAETRVVNWWNTPSDPRVVDPRVMNAVPFPVAFDSSAKIFEMLLRGTTRAYEELDAIFRENGLANTEKAYRSTKMEQDATNGTMMEFVASKVLPYDMQATLAAVWSHFGYSQPIMPDRKLSGYHDECKGIESADDTITSSYCLQLSNAVASVKFDEWRIVRRFTEANRVIIIICLLAETTEFASQPTDGIRILERTFIELRRPSGAPNNATLMQTCYRVQPVMYKDSPGLEDTVAALTDFVFAFVAGTISTNYQMIEKALRAQSAPCLNELVTTR